MSVTRILFGTDIHASDRCFRKFLRAAQVTNGPDVLIIGGDITGKYLVPIIAATRGRFHARFEGRDYQFTNASEVTNFEEALKDRGAYFWHCDQSQAEQFQEDPEFQGTIDRQVRSERLKKWVTWADEALAHSQRRVFVSGGNDDPWYVDDIIRKSETIECPDGQVVSIADSLVMLSCGVANQTPWNCPRDLPEVEIALRINHMAGNVIDFQRCLFNLHCPPFDTLLDRAPKLDENLHIVASAFGVEVAPVGSTAVREAIELYQPVASLHGHVHESRGFQRIGRTLAFNPGSEYAIGRLNVALLEFEDCKLVNFELKTDLN